MRFQAMAQNTFAEADTRSIKDFLHENFEGKNFGMVIGLLDKNGTQIFSAGKLDNGTEAKVDADTVFEIGSITKTFTTLLLLDMVERGQMRLEDPVEKYLPATVKVPSRGGKEITLLNLAAQDSALPFNADNLKLVSHDWVKAYNAYTAQDMYAFLSRFTLPEEPGAKFQYSNIGMSLLGHVMELKTGTNFESLVLDRICRPLQMSSTDIKISPALKERMATGHDEKGHRAAYYHLQVMEGAGALNSTANDLLKYLAANLGLGLRESSLRPLMEKTQVIRHTDSLDMGRTAMPWYDKVAYNPPGTELLGHGGGTGGFATFIGFDKKQRHGIVVLSNQINIHSSVVGFRILQHARLSGTDPTKLDFVCERVGTGIAFDSDKETHLARITVVYPESFAAKAGLSAGMMIQKIDGVSTLNKSTPECLTLFRANGASTVRLEVFDPKKEKTMAVVLARGKFLTENIP